MGNWTTWLVILFSFRRDVHVLCVTMPARKICAQCKAAEPVRLKTCVVVEHTRVYIAVACMYTDLVHVLRIHTCWVFELQCFLFIINSHAGGVFFVVARLPCCGWLGLREDQNFRESILRFLVKWDGRGRARANIWMVNFQPVYIAMVIIMHKATC